MQFHFISFIISNILFNGIRRQLLQLPAKPNLVLNVFQRLRCEISFIFITPRLTMSIISQFEVIKCDLIWFDLIWRSLIVICIREFCIITIFVEFQNTKTIFVEVIFAYHYNLGKFWFIHNISFSLVWFLKVLEQTSAQSVQWTRFLWSRRLLGVLFETVNNCCINWFVSCAAESSSSVWNTVVP
jgi:hypothetical protein